MGCKYFTVMIIETSKYNPVTILVITFVVALNSFPCCHVSAVRRDLNIEKGVGETYMK